MCNVHVHVHVHVHIHNIICGGPRAPRQACLESAHLDADDVLVVEVAKNFDLAQRALRVRQVLKRLVDLFDGDPLAGEVVHGGADDSIRAVANGLDERVPGVDIESSAGNHEGIYLPIATLLRLQRRLVDVHFRRARESR